MPNGQVDAEFSRLIWTNFSGPDTVLNDGDLVVVVGALAGRLAPDCRRAVDRIVGTRGELVIGALGSYRSARRWFGTQCVWFFVGQLVDWMRWPVRFPFLTEARRCRLINFGCGMLPR